MGFSRQEYWSGLPFPPPGDLPNPRIKPVSPALQADSLLLSHQGRPTFASYTSFKFKNLQFLESGKLFLKQSPPHIFACCSPCLECLKLRCLTKKKERKKVK